MRNPRLPVVLTLALASVSNAQVRLEQPALPSTAPTVLATLAVAQPAGSDPVAFARRAADLVAHLPAVEWIAEARADALGPGVEPAFLHVRDAIRYEAYAGVLRGASGTYAARAGNAADRALLLACLLGRKQVRTRFAIGTLAAADCDRLWQRTFDTSIPLAGLPAGSGSVTDGKSFRQHIVARATRDFGVVRAALGDHLPPVTAPSRNEVLAEMNPHVWLQAEIDGAWVDLDPSFADARPGVAVAKVERTAAELPAELFQRVSIRVVVEQLHDGKLVRELLLDLTRNAVDLVDRQIFVVHTPGKPMAMAGLSGAMTGHDAWTPGLWIDGDFTWGKMLTIHEGSPANTGVPGPKQGGLQGAVDALAPEPDSAPTPGPVFVAEWLEFELSGPGIPREVSRRVLAERAGTAWRANSPLDAKGLKPLRRDAEGPLAMRAMHNVWFSAGPHNLAAYASAMEDLAIDALSQAVGDPPPEASDFGVAVWPLALQNFTWMVWTDHAVIPSLDRTPGVRVYTDRPRIAIFTNGPDVDGGALFMSDLRRDDLRAIAAAPDQGSVLADKKLWFALLQGALEHEGIGQILASFRVDPATVVTTSSHLAADGVVVLTPGSSLPAGRRADPESAARVAVALGERSVVVAPWSGLGAGGAWWEITAGRGDARAVGELGLHSGSANIPPKNVPYITRKPPQQNSYGGPKPVNTPEANKEARDNIMRNRNARKEAEAIRKYEESQKNLAKPKPRGGSEYTVLTTCIVVVGSAATALLGYLLSMQFMAAVDALSSD